MSTSAPLPLAIAILAAGKGTRMKSAIPKVLHKLGSVSLLQRVVTTALTLQPERCLVIVGHAQDQLRAAIGDQNLEWVEQLEQKGTGHAIQQLIPYLQAFKGHLLVLSADVPLIRIQTLQALYQKHQQTAASATVLTAHYPDPTGYGRVFTGSDGLIEQIVEHRDCTPEQRQNSCINSGIYCFDWQALATVLPTLTSQNQQQEYYLTDAVRLLPTAQAQAVEDVSEILGINDRIQLAEAYQILQTRIKTDWMRAGVTLLDPGSITIEDQVQLEADVVIEPQAHLRGQTLIKTGCLIGSGSLIDNSSIGANCRILHSVVSDSEIGANTTVGPFAHIRAHSQIGEQCRIGNFVEIKNSHIQSHTNAAHLAYIGDASLGEQVNIGAGTIIANYDGVQKHRTQIGDRSKTGANSVLIAPLTVGQDVTIAAGSTISEDLPDDCLAIARARQVIKPGWRLRQKLGDGSEAKSHPDPS